MINIIILTVIMQAAMAPPPYWIPGEYAWVKRCDPRLVEWLKMDLTEPGKRPLLQNLVKDPEINFNCQGRIKLEYELESRPSLGSFPVVEDFDKDGVMNLPLGITQVIQMGDLDSAKTLLERKVEPDEETCYAALRTGNMDLIKQVLNSESSKDNYPQFYPRHAVASGNPEALQFVLGLQGSDKGDKFMGKPDLTRVAEAIGENGSSEMLKMFLDFVGADELRHSYIQTMEKLARDNSDVREQLKLLKPSSQRSGKFSSFSNF